MLVRDDSSIRCVMLSTLSKAFSCYYFARCELFLLSTTLVLGMTDAFGKIYSCFQLRMLDEIEAIV